MLPRIGGAVTTPSFNSRLLMVPGTGPAGHIAAIPGVWLPLGGQQPSHTRQSGVDKNTHRICIYLHSMSEILKISNKVGGMVDN